MRDCENYIELANLSVDGLLTEEENESLRAHLESCPDCRRRAEAAGAMSAAFSQMEAEPPDTLAPGIKYKLSLEPSEKKSWRRFMPGSLTVAAACVALIILFSQSKDSGGPPTFGGISSREETDYGASYSYFDSVQMAPPEASMAPQPTAEPEDELEANTTSDSSAKGAETADDAGNAQMTGQASAEASPEPSGTFAVNSEGFSANELGAAMDIDMPGDGKYMGIMLAEGDIPEELEGFEVVEGNGLLYVLLPAEKFETYTAASGGAFLEDSERIDPEAEQGVVVFSK